MTVAMLIIDVFGFTNEFSHFKSNQIKPKIILDFSIYNEKPLKSNINQWNGKQRDYYVYYRFIAFNGK